MLTVSIDATARVAQASERAVPHKVVAIKIKTLRVCVSLFEPNPISCAGRERTRQMSDYDFRVVLDIANGESLVARCLAVDRFPL